MTRSIFLLHLFQIVQISQLMSEELMKLLGTLLGALCVAALPIVSADADYNSGLKAYRMKDYPRAIKEFKTDDSKNSNYNLGVIYFKGEGVKADHLQGLEYFKKAAEQGHMNAQFLIDRKSVV